MLALWEVNSSSRKTKAMSVMYPLLLIALAVAVTTVTTGPVAKKQTQEDAFFNDLAEEGERIRSLLPPQWTVTGEGFFFNRSIGFHCRTVRDHPEIAGDAAEWRTAAAWTGSQPKPRRWGRRRFGQRTFGRPVVWEGRPIRLANGVVDRQYLQIESASGAHPSLSFRYRI